MVQSNSGKADLARAQQEATRIQTLAGAEASRIRMLGEGEAGKIQALAGAEAQRAARVGVAQALAIEEQVRAYGGPRFQLTQQVMNRFAEAIETSGVDVVPRVVVGGGGRDGNGDGGGITTSNVMQGLLTLLLSEKIGGDATAPSTARSAEAEAIRRQIREGMENGKQER